jgi:mxaA protein
MSPPGRPKGEYRSAQHAGCLMTRLRRCGVRLAWVFAFVFVFAPATVGAAAPAMQLDASTVEPRAFGYQVGDVVSRAVHVHVPNGLRLEEASLPQPGARGKAIELRSVARRSRAEPGGQRIELTLEYQLFLAPPQTRTLELPTFTLRFQGEPRAQDIRVDAWPVTVAPLVPVEVSPRRGLGEMQPDAAAPLIDTSGARKRLLVYAGGLLLLLGYLGHVYVGLPWWSRTRRPFTQTWRALRRMSPASPEPQWRKAFQRLHEALNATAGEVVFEPGIERFIRAQPRFQPLRDDLATFFAHSRRVFFAQAAPTDPERRWLIEFCRRCRDAERGAA